MKNELEQKIYELKQEARELKIFEKALTVMNWEDTLPLMDSKDLVIYSGEDDKIPDVISIREGGIMVYEGNKVKKPWKEDTAVPKVEVTAYIRGDWIGTLEEAYKETLRQKENEQTQSKIEQEQDLLERFGLEDEV